METTIYGLKIVRSIPNQYGFISKCPFKKKHVNTHITCPFTSCRSMPFEDGKHILGMSCPTLLVSVIMLKRGLGFRVLRTDIADLQSGRCKHER